ncbi:MAG: secretin N-terminal domain-containing protein [Pseudomonadota bacterium]
MRGLPLLVAITLSGCSGFAPIETVVNRQIAIEPAPVEQPRNPGKTPDIPLEQRLAFLNGAADGPDDATEHLYSFVAQNLPIQQALEIFREAYGLNIVADQDVGGSITADFRDLPFDQAMDAMLASLGLYWQQEGKLVRVRARQTRTFVIDYIRLVRGGSGSALAQISSGQSGSEGGGDGGGGGDNGAITIEHEDTVEFWKELEEQLETLVSESGRLVINRMAGTVQVSDHYLRVTDIGTYIAAINRAIHRQVEIDVRIVEVTLNEDFSLGIDWSRISDPGSEGVGFDFQTSGIVQQPSGGFIAKLPSIAASIFNPTGNGGFEFVAMLDALKEQGTVRVVSQPQVRVLNNQSAMIKVGTDRTFFRREVTTNNTSAGSTLEAEDVPQVVTEGIVLSLTPQIATNGWIMLDVSPVITRVSSISVALDSNGQVRSTAPNLDIRQASSLVRLKNGETIVIGGLIQDQASDTERGVPGISDVPLAGNLFKGKYQLRGKRELVMFLTAKLVDATEVALR